MRSSGVGYLGTLLIPALAIVLGVAIIVDPSVIPNRGLDWRLPFGVLWILGGVLPAVFVLGMSVELDSDQVTKVYLFGMVRETIPIASLSATTVVRLGYRSGRARFTRFMNANGPGLFELAWFQWPVTQIDGLQQLAPVPWSVDAKPRRQHALLWAALAFAVTAVVALVVLWNVVADARSVPL